MSWKNYESGGGEEDTYATYGRDCGGSVLNRERSTLSLSLSAPITGLIIWQGTIGQPHLPEMELLPFPPVLRVTESDRPPPPRSLLRRYYPLVRSSSQFRLGTTATISATSPHRHSSTTRSLYLSLFFDRSHVYKLDLPPIILILEIIDHPRMMEGSGITPRPRTKIRVASFSGKGEVRR